MTRQRLLAAVILLLFTSFSALAQLPPDAAENDAGNEKFLLEAEIVESEQMSASEGVTRPYKMSLKMADREADAIWKNPDGRMGGYIEGWKYEIAAYRLDRYLGLNMVPVTVERRFNKNRGAIQLWLEDCYTMRELKGPAPEGVDVDSWNRRTYLQRAFDNLIANNDRHLGNVMIDPDDRMILIDHTRAFRAKKRDIKKLVFEHGNPPKPMKELPRWFIEKLTALDEAKLEELVGDYLTVEEKSAVLARKPMILELAAKAMKYNGSPEGDG